MRFQVKGAILGCFSLILTACGGTDNNVEDDLQIDRGSDGFVVYFAPADGVLPFPSNLLISTEDGTLDIPVEDENDFSDPQVALNTLDGFSTMAPMRAEFSLALDPATINGQTVHLYEVTLTGGAVTGVTRELTYGVEFIASLSPVDPTNKTLTISPFAPLKPKTSYMIALTNGIQSADGRTVVADITYRTTKQTTPLVDGGISQVPILSNEQAAVLEPLRQLTNLQELALAGQGLNSDIVALSWTFTTQSIGDVLSTVRTMSQTYGPTTTFIRQIGDTGSLLGQGDNAADVYEGTLTLPYYLTNGTVPTDPLNKFWQGAEGSHLTQYNTTPVQTSEETIPVLLTVPKGAGIGLKPVVIFQHGITQNRSNLLTVADSLASAGFIGIAIDMPLHGITPEDLFAGLRMAGFERNFDLDLVNNTTRAPGPDGIDDDSGTHYINLSNLLVSRDNVRQSSADLIALFDSLATLDYDNDTNLDIDTDQVYFLGHSLGAMAGTSFLAQVPEVKDAVMAMPGSGIAKLLDGSATFGPIIEAGLLAATQDSETPLIKGEAAYESFMGAAQTVLDSADPGNYTTGAATGRGILLFEVVGDGNTNLPDQTIPNNVLSVAGTVPAPLAGTDPFAKLLGLTQVDTTTSSTSDMKSYIRFTAGYHGSILDPSVDPLADATTTIVMQTAAATFFVTAGQNVTISDETVVEEAAE